MRNVPLFIHALHNLPIFSHQSGCQCSCGETAGGPFLRIFVLCSSYGMVYRLKHFLLSMFWEGQQEIQLPSAACP